MKDLSEVKNIVGWLGDLEVDNLYRYAMEAPTNHAIEIGSFCGKSSVAIGLAMQERHGSVICIDRMDCGFNYSLTPNAKGKPDPSGKFLYIPCVMDTFMDNIKKFDLENTITHFQVDARFILPKTRGKFGLIFIDADHTVNGCLNDALWAYDHIEPSGYIVFHDYHNIDWGAGVTKSVDAVRHIWEGEWSFYWITAAFKKS